MILTFLKKLFKIKPKVPECSNCKFRVGGLYQQNWYCSKKYTKKGKYWIYTSICGKPRVKTHPKFCPLTNKN